MTRRNREHLPRIDRPIGAVRWTLSMEVSEIVVAKLREQGHLPKAKTSVAVPDHSRQTANDSNLPTSVQELEFRFRALSDKVYAALADAQSADDVRMVINRLTTGDAISEAISIGSAAKLLVPEEVAKEPPVIAVSASVSQDASDTFSAALRALIAVNEAVKEISTTGEFTVDDVSAKDVADALHGASSLPPRLTNALLGSLRGTVAYYAFYVSTAAENKRPPIHATTAASVMLEGALESARLLASLFPGCIPDDIIPPESLLDVDAMFAEHAVRMFPFDEMRALIINDRPQAAATLVLRGLNTLLVRGRFKACDAVLASMPLGDITPTIAVVCLTITSHGADMLPSRPEFVQRVRYWLEEKMGTDKAAAVMENLG
ncbi:MAG: hypothetical protein EPO40_14735 [Myxococcaceae bacterium]|nr:MAG: hypothetical protein EPO40_14735 [Myxococcaceae bacterium]